MAQEVVSIIINLINLNPPHETLLVDHIISKQTNEIENFYLQ